MQQKTMFLPAYEHSEACLCHSPAFLRINTVLTRQAAKAPPITTATVAAAIPAGQSTHSNAAASATQLKAFINVRIFDGVSDQLREGMQVIVEGNKIKSIEPADTPPPAQAKVIDGNGGVLMPGLIDAHWHAIMARPSMMTAMTADFNYIQALAIAEAQATLLRRVHYGPRYGWACVWLEARN